MNPEPIIFEDLNRPDYQPDVNAELHNGKMILIWPKGTNVLDELTVWIEDGKLYVRQAYTDMKIKLTKINSDCVCIESVFKNH